MANGGPIRSGALTAGAITFLAMAMLYRREATKCTDLSSIWKEDGPIHLNQSVQDEAFSLGAQKLRSVDAAGESMSVVDLGKYMASHFASSCNWDKPESPRAEVVLASFQDIARYSMKEFYGEEVQ